MKKILLYASILVSLATASCNKEETPPANDAFDATGKTLLGQASFQSDAHTTSGTVKIYADADKKYVVFENFKTDDGPDLYVYLAADLGAKNFTQVSRLTNLSGNFNYVFDKNVNEKTQNKVLIWCKKFSVLFGHAAL